MGLVRGDGWSSALITAPDRQLVAVPGRTPPRARAAGSYATRSVSLFDIREPKLC